MTAENRAGLSTDVTSSPLILDISVPVAGDVRDGSNFMTDVSWMGSNSTFTGQLIGCSEVPTIY